MPISFGRGKSERQLLERFAGKLLVEAGARNKDALDLTARKVNATLAEVHIEGLTELAHYASPESIREMVNAYLACVQKVIHAREGMVGSFFGETLHASFGAPRDAAEHPFSACLAALDMQRELARLAADWHAKGFARVSQSIALVTATMVVGNFGSDERAHAACLGPGVLFAQQLRQATRLYRAPIIISRETWLAVRARVVSRELDVVSIVGGERKTSIHELLGVMGQGPDELRFQCELYEAALELYRQRDFAAARKKFEDVDRMVGDDGPSRLFMRRCELYLENPPPPEWDGQHQPFVRRPIFE